LLPYQSIEKIASSDYEDGSVANSSMENEEDLKFTVYKFT